MIRGFIKLAIVILVLGYFLEMPFSGSNSRVHAGENKGASATEKKESGKTEAKKKRKVKRVKTNHKKVKVKKKQGQ
ncbi:MAG: hypothetical protein IKQ97_07190 [Eubacterium sp.]|nr:hypothetical protein [Eubacterium sp.]